MNKSTPIALLILGLTTLGCWGSIDQSGDDEKTPDPDELIGAGDRDITDFWPSIDLPYSENTQLLSFDMLRNEVLRATGISWVEGGTDQWNSNRSILGGADYVNTFTDDRTISQQKIVTIRKMAFSVCGDVVATDAGSVFTDVSPDAAIAADDSSVQAQVRSMFTRFFLVEPSESQVAESSQLLLDLQAQGGSGEAWRGLCGAYLASMRFLTY